LFIGVIGLGAVGSAEEQVLSYLFKDSVVGYDIVGDYDWAPILETDVVIVCVPTPGKDGRLDCSAVRDVIQRLDDSNYRGVVVIKSTLRVGFMDKTTQEFPNQRLVYCPEFLREKSRLQWAACPDRVVISGNPEDVDVVRHVFEFAEDAPVLIMDHRSAEVAKLAHNAFIASKVSFTNEIERICGILQANPDDVMSVIHADRRVRSKEHLKPGLGPYGGRCIPKDTKELMNAAGGSAFFEAVEKVNADTEARYQ
jgi:UDPglucose 6-dehydrogenase